MEQFWQFLMTEVETRPELPQFYILHGEEGQRHESFVQRLVIEKFEPDAVSLKGEMEGATKHVMHEPQPFWPSLEDAKNSFTHGMFREMFGIHKNAYNTKRVSVRDLCVHPNLKRYHQVVLEHNFEVEAWDEQLKPLVDWYFNSYWMEYARGESPIQFKVFLNFIYRRPRHPRWRRWLHSGRVVEKFLDEISARVNERYPCLLFKELGPPEKREVCRTLRKAGLHQHFDGCPDWLEALFKEKGKKIKMIDIENRLQLRSFRPTTLGQQVPK
jgi:hypothetical protein